MPQILSLSVCCDVTLVLVSSTSSLIMQLLSQESEELNRVFVCVLAQSMHISSKCTCDIGLHASNLYFYTDLDTTNWLEAFMRAVFTAAPQK